MSLNGRSIPWDDPDIIGSLGRPLAPEIDPMGPMARGSLSHAAPWPRYRVFVGYHAADLGPEMRGTMVAAPVECYTPYFFMDVHGYCEQTRTCSAEEYQTTAPTPMSDRVCTPRTQCGVAAYQSYAGTATTDRNCTLLSRCTPGTQYVSMGATATSDRGCSQTRCDPSS